MLKILFALSLLTQPALSYSAEHYHLVKVVVTGSKRYSTEDLGRATGLKPNSEVTQDDLQNAAKRLGGSGAFTGVQFTFMPAKGVRGVEADFAVTDAEQFLPVSFDNFLWFSDSDLQQLVHEAVPLFNGSVPQSGTMTEDVKAALVQALSEKGLPNQVSYTLSAAEAGQPISAVSYKVDNAGFKIADFRFTNNSHLPSDALLQSLAFLKDQEYSYSLIKQALTRNLVPVCQNRGFLKCAVDAFNPELQQQAVTIVADISEGPQFKLSGYQWSGNTLIPTAELTKHITIKVGEPVDFSRLQDDLAKVKKAYGKFGREAATVNALPAFNGDQVAYTFQVNEGDVFHMGTVEFLGMDSALAQKLQAAWKLSEGQPYDNTYYQRFIAGIAMSNPGRQLEWSAVEDIDSQRKTVNLKLQLRSR
jgi:outer membrane protein assembly factor BamA